MRYWRCAWAFRERRRPAKQHSLASPVPRNATSVTQSKDLELRDANPDHAEAQSDFLALRRRYHTHQERPNGPRQVEKRDRCSFIPVPRHTAGGRNKEPAFSSWMRTGIFSFGTHRSTKRRCNTHSQRISRRESVCTMHELEGTSLLREQPIRNNSSFFIDNVVPNSYALEVTLDAAKVAHQTEMDGATDDVWAARNSDESGPNPTGMNQQPKRKSLRRLSALSFRALKLARLMGFRGTASGNSDVENHPSSSLPEDTRELPFAHGPSQNESGNAFQSVLTGNSKRDAYVLSSSPSSSTEAETARRKRKKKKSVHFMPLAAETSDESQIQGRLGALFNRQNSLRSQEVIVAVLEFDAEKPVECISGKAGTALPPSDALEGLGLRSFSALRKSSRRTKSRTPALPSSERHKIFRDTGYDEDAPFWTPFDVLTPEFEGDPSDDGALPCGFYFYNTPAGIDQAYELSKMNASSMYNESQYNAPSENATKDPVTAAAAIAAQYRKHVALTALRFAAQRGRSRCMSVPPEVYRTQSSYAPAEQRRRSSVPLLVPQTALDHPAERFCSGPSASPNRPNRRHPATAPKTLAGRPVTLLQTTEDSRSSIAHEFCSVASSEPASEPSNHTPFASEVTVSPTGSLSVTPNDTPIHRCSAASDAETTVTGSFPAPVSLCDPPRPMPVRNTETTSAFPVAHIRTIACGCCSWPLRSSLSGGCAGTPHTSQKASVAHTTPNRQNGKRNNQEDATNNHYSTHSLQIEVASADPLSTPSSTVSIKPTGAVLRFLESPLSAEISLSSLGDSQKRVAPGRTGRLSNSHPWLLESPSDTQPLQPLSHLAPAPLSSPLTSPLESSSPRSFPAVRL